MYTRAHLLCTHTHARTERITLNTHPRTHAFKQRDTSTHIQTQEYIQIKQKDTKAQLPCAIYIYITRKHKS